MINLDILVHKHEEAYIVNKRMLNIIEGFFILTLNIEILKSVLIGCFYSHLFSIHKLWLYKTTCTAYVLLQRFIYRF